MTVVVPGPADLAVAALFVLVAALISVARSLGLARSLVVAALRLAVQITLVGLVLRFVLALASPALTGLVIVAMTLAATAEAGARQKSRLKGWWHYAIAFGAVAGSAATVVLIALTTVLKPEPWYAARYAIPLAGIILGNVMNCVSLALDRFLAEATNGRASIEARLLAGATLGRALGPARQAAARAALMPLVNQMAAAGIVTLPGIMTGQVLAGLDPLAAGRYQILLMFALAGGGVAAVALTLDLATRRIGDERERLRLDRLKSTP